MAKHFLVKILLLIIFISIFPQRHTFMVIFAIGEGEAKSSCTMFKY